MTPPLRKTDPLLLTKTDPLYAHVSVGEAELNGMTGGEDGSLVELVAVGWLSGYREWKRLVLEQVLKMGND